MSTLRCLVATVREQASDASVSDAEIVRHIGDAVKDLHDSGMVAATQPVWQDDIVVEAVRRVLTGERT